MTMYTLTIRLTDEQQQRLEAVTAAINRRFGRQRNAAETFNMIMQTGIAHVINDRLELWGSVEKEGEKKDI